MNKRKESHIKYVNLHSHTTCGSIFDAIGYPQQHFDYCYGNGGEAMAITDHGNCNAVPYMVQHVKKMRAEGKEFKAIFGCEAYFLPSIDDWREEYEKAKLDKKRARNLAKGKASASTVEDEGSSKADQDILRRRRHLVVLAQNQTGLNNLFKLVSESYKPENYYRYPRMDFKLLEKYNEGLIVSSACLGGPLSGDFWENREKGPEAVRAAMLNTVTRFKDILGDRFYGEIQWNNIPEQHQVNKHIIDVCDELDVKLISTADSHYPSPEAWKDRELYKRLGWLGKGKPSWADGESGLPEEVEETGYELYPKNGDQMWDSYRLYSEKCGYEYDDDLISRSIEETHDIAFNRIENFLPDTTVRLPDFVVPAGYTATQALVQFSLEGLKEKGLHTNNVYIDRLKHELNIIDDRGFSKYFLTMKAIYDEAREKMLIGPGRGSSCGSLAAYVLNLTAIDPLKYDLPFERFLRADAVDFPDIDGDFSKNMELKEHLIEKWGEDRVVPISNWNTLQLKSLIKDISRFYDIPFTESNIVTNVMINEATPLAKQKHGITAGVYAPTWNEVLEFSPALIEYLNKYPQVKTHVDGLVGQTKSCGRHAAGLVIGEDLDKHMPLIVSGGVRQAPWSEGQNVRHLEPMGFIKFDILGLSTLRMFETCIEHILKRHMGIENPSFLQIREFYDTNLHPDKIDLNNQEVYENVFHAGKWASVFQFTNSGAQQFCTQVKPSSIEEVSAVTSIYRPGPLSSGVHNTFLSAKNGTTDIEWYHPIFKEITEETYGHVIFQEQISEITHRIGKGISRDEGNTIRKLLTKRGTGKEHLLDGFRQKFIEGALEKSITEQVAGEIWEVMEGFAKYGFSKNHSTAYSVISFQCAWLWNYYPVEWMASVLQREPEAKKEQAINTAKQYGFNIAPLDINKSSVVWEITEDGKTLVQPLTAIKGFGMSAITQVMDNRPFLNAEDLLFRKEVVYSKLNKKCLDALCRAGALDGIIDDRFTGRKHFWSACVVDRPKLLKNLYKNIEMYKEEGDFSEEEIIQFKTELTGVFPMNLVISPETVQSLKDKFIPPISEFDDELQVCWFIPRKVTLKKTKTGKHFWVLEVIDSNNELTRIRCWGIKPDKDKIHINRPYMSRLSYDENWGFSTRSVYHNFRLLA